MKRVCVYTCNRSEYSRLYSVMHAISLHPDLSLKIVAGGSHLLNRFGYTIRDIENDGFEIDEKIYAVIEGGTLEAMAKSVGLALIELTTYFARTRPDMLLVIGDRFDLLPAVISAAMQNIPIVHIQGGERTGTIDESIRHVVTKFSHLHFPATEKSREFIIQMGEQPENVINTGCPAIDLLLKTAVLDRKSLFASSEVVAKIGASPNPDEDYILLLQHPVTTEYQESFSQMMETLTAVREIDMQTILLSPNLDAGSDPMVIAIKKFQYLDPWPKLYTYRHISTPIFFNLLRHANCIVGNSSAGIRESCYFGTPCVNIGTRQKNREYGKNVINVGYNRHDIRDAIRRHLTHGRYTAEFLYGDGHAGKRIAHHLATVNLSPQK